MVDEFDDDYDDEYGFYEGDEGEGKDEDDKMVSIVY